jgi:hypothetical protein
LYISDATGEEHSFDATSDFPTAVGPAMTITNGLYGCSFSAVAAAHVELAMLLLFDMRAGLALLENESGFTLFFEFIRSVDARELKYADDVLDEKRIIGLSI